jgi:hypothetical protein
MLSYKHFQESELVYFVHFCIPILEYVDILAGRINIMVEDWRSQQGTEVGERTCVDNIMGKPWDWLAVKKEERRGDEQGKEFLDSQSRSWKSTWYPAHQSHPGKGLASFQGAAPRLGPLHRVLPSLFCNFSLPFFSLSSRMS